ncbi:MAG: hypothetical protein HY403_06045 [Elusimicrobia bacterium]|nr:hypothetical protein [Elusimicrobiota bacterium]
MSDTPEALESVMHEVGSKASSLSGAAALLGKATPAEREELLALMAQHAEFLAQFLAKFKKDGKLP